MPGRADARWRPRASGRPPTLPGDHPELAHPARPPGAPPSPAAMRVHARRVPAQEDVRRAPAPGRRPVIGWASLMRRARAASRTRMPAATGARSAASPLKSGREGCPTTLLGAASRGARAKDGRPRLSRGPAGARPPDPDRPTHPSGALRAEDEAWPRPWSSPRSRAWRATSPTRSGGFSEADGYFESDDLRRDLRGRATSSSCSRPRRSTPSTSAGRSTCCPILPERVQATRPKKGQTDRIRTIKKLLAREDVERGDQRLRRRARGRADLPRDRRVPRHRRSRSGASGSSR